MGQDQEEGVKYQKYLEEKHSKFGVESTLVEGIIEKTTGSAASEIKRVLAGEVNEVYDVRTKDRNLIVRISHNEEGRFPAEKWAIDRAKEAGVPAPDILLIEEVKNNGKTLTVCVETKLPGKPLNQIANSLAEEDLKKIIEEAGEILAKIHSVTPQKFGNINEKGVGQYDSWEEYMLKPLRPQKVKALLEAAEKASIPKEQIDKALQILAEHSDLYTGVTPHLLHGDYGPKHILINNGKISGILDFENAKSGDPIHDFAWWSYFSKNRPPVDWLKKGYVKILPLPDNFELKLRLGRLRLAADMIWYYNSEGHNLGLSVAKVNLQEDLDFFSSQKSWFA